ncbi:MAG: ATP-binding protein, partial [Candidatus Aminicenantales bacterium]
EVIGREASFYFEGEQETYDLLQPLFNGNKDMIYVESWQRRKDGQKRLLAWQCRVLKDERGNVTGALSSARDITERQLAEEDLKRALADLERSNKELEQFASVASHDLQEPLRMVASYTQLLAQRYENRLDDKAKKYIDYAVDGAVRMQRLINDLLTYSRIGTRGNPLEPTDAHSALGEAIKNLAATIEENRAIITNDELPTVRADASQLVQVFQNLIANAIKFRGKDIPRVHVSAQDHGREWVFSVRDNGIGIDPQYADRIFQIFQRLHTRQEYPGTGIGLAVCKRILERHGGRIWFESEPGKGSTFFFAILK